MLAYYEKGEKIEVYYNNEWVLCENPKWNWEYVDYRIKPHYRAFNDTDEMYNSMKQHGVKVRDKVRKEWNFILFNSDLVYIYRPDVYIKLIQFEDLFNDYVFNDGTPCGVEYNLNTI